MAMDLAAGGSMSPQSPRSASSLQRRGSDMANKHDGAPTEDAKVIACHDITIAVVLDYTLLE